LSSTYRQAGVSTNAELGLAALLKWVQPTLEFRREAGIGRSVLDIGYFANVIDLGRGLGLALSTDGVGTKVLVAEMLGRYDTIGIDCVAMNVNDVICVGAEPIAMLDYIAVEAARPDMLEAIGRGLHEGAKRAGVGIVGGEISQVSEIIRGARDGEGLDLVGMCVGVVPLDEVNVGRAVRPGDALVGLRSSGIHSNGLTLARMALFQAGALAPDTHVAELGRSVGEELLEPTRIYVPEVLDLLRQRLPVRALVNITGDGLLNLARIDAPTGYRIDALPAPPPIFELIRRAGRIDDAEMYRVFNMGIGFCLVVPDDGAVLSAVHATVRRHGGESFVLGRVVEDPARRVVLTQKRLVGRADRFEAVTGAV
jgi:phosphoribosylformylglycinamidine cyclo-ligase